MKPLLIINCSARKAKATLPALDLYEGGFFTQLKSNLGDVRQYFDVLIVSALHGVLEQDSLIDYYNTEMPKLSDSEAYEVYRKKHQRTALKTINRYASKDREVFVWLSSKYQHALESFYNGNLEQELSKKFKAYYIPKKTGGLPGMRARFKRMCKYVRYGAPEACATPRFFRSGIANENELGYLAAGNDFGSSLAYINTELNPDRLTTLLSQLELTNQRYFVDNGYFTLIKKNKNVDTTWVFNQFKAIAKRLSKAAKKQLYIVIPDDAQCPERAAQILNQHKRDIIRLLDDGVNCILPIHRVDNPRLHTTKLMQELDFDERITLGCPCVRKPDVDLRIELSQIDTMLSIKSPITKNPLFSRVHYLGLTDASYNSVLEPRLLLARLHKVECTTDGCRTPAIFGKTKTGTLLKGSAKVLEIEGSHHEQTVKSTDEYTNYDMYSEHHAPEGEAYVTQYLYDLINPDQIQLFFIIYNEIMIKDAYCRVDVDWQSVTESDVEDYCEMAWDLIGQRYIRVKIFETLKYFAWRKFEHYAATQPLSSFEKRFRAIKELFMVHPSPIQRPLSFTALAS